MDFLLVVVRAFGAHAPGDTIDAPDAVRDVLDGAHADKVVRVARPAPQTPGHTATKED